jgi:TRAP-type C4-dicarboxylate transport system permease small subunit
MLSEKNPGIPVPDQGAGMTLVTVPAKILSIIACIFLFAMMAVTFIDVVGRYVFSSPLPAAYEIVALIMPAIIFCALPLTVLNNGHVTVDLLDSFVPKWMEKIQQLIVNVFGAAALALLSWRLAVRSQDQNTYEEVTDELVLELWPISAAMSILCAVAALMFVAKLYILIFNPTAVPGAKTIE